MAASTAKHLIKTLFNCRGSYRLENVRYATGLRKSKRLGKVPELARTFEQRLAGIEKKVDSYISNFLQQPFIL